MWRPIKLLAISFAFPPLSYPRSIQVARLLKSIRASTVLVCGEEKQASRDPSLEPDAVLFLEKCIRVPFSCSQVWQLVGTLARWVRVPFLHRTPDKYRRWRGPVLSALDEFVWNSKFYPDVLVTFASPMSGHLIGISVSEQYGLPWVAHFSDPWVDNPFNRYDALTRMVNAHMERKVIEAAARVVFTSEETMDLVMRKYPIDWKLKARVVPHSFDETLYPRALLREGKLTVRHIGSFHGWRSPRPLVEALRNIVIANDQTLADVQFELIGPMGAGGLSDRELKGLPEGLLTRTVPVEYRDSLSLMARADGLLLIDAPTDKNVFLPSKLIDYIGSGRPILALSPPGTSARVVEKLGGWVADVRDPASIRKNILSFVSYLRETRRNNDSGPWGEPIVREQYSISRVCRQFQQIIEELHSGDKDA